MVDWEQFIGFDWDAGNSDKNWEKHGESDSECEEVFLNQPLVVRYDPSHSGEEPRCWALGHADNGRLLFVAFTLRNELIRVISARVMTRRERSSYSSYEEHEEKA